MKAGSKPDTAVARKPRIFFLGAHKLLVQTEVRRLRELGYEVFNPPYLSHILDQSAQARWDADQETTLPPSVFEVLSRYNFFYNSFDTHIAELLNDYFDAVVVTIVARWATEVARLFSGPIIFRSYGQTSLLTDDFETIGARPIIEGHDAFHFCPHSAETLETEADWLRQKAIVIPYCLSGDIFHNTDAWLEQPERSGDILVTAPNILGNVFHLSHYHFLKEFFCAPQYRMCGVQLIPVPDPQVVGTLSRDRQFDMFVRASGYLYTYSDPRVCYLPPIEMMVLGGPVVYFPNTLLSRYIGAGGPGEVATIEAAHRLCDRLRAGDHALVADIQTAQTPVRDRYDPSFVWPIFDREMRRILPKQGSSDPPERELLTPTRRLRQFLKGYLASALSDTNERSEGRLQAAADLLALTPQLGEAYQPTLDRVLVERGPQAAVADLVAESGGDGPKLLQASIGDAAIFVKRELGGQTNYLHAGSRLAKGRWHMDAEAGVRVARTEEGTEGFLVYGPYIDLPGGRHRIAFSLDAQGGSGGVGTVDVVAAGTVLASAEIEGDQVQRILLDFDTGDQLKAYEFRVHSNGQAAISLSSIVMVM